MGSFAPSSSGRGAAQRCDIRSVLVGAEVQRSAAEGSKAGAEDYTCIDQIGALDDLLIAALLAFPKQRLDQLTPKALQFKGSVGLLGDGLDRFAILPRIKTLARLLAELAGGHHLVELRAPRRRQLEDVADVGADVETDGIGELDRPHRHAEHAGRL